MNLEALVTHPEGFAIAEASPCQRAICRVITGVPLAELASDPDVIAMLGGVEAVRALVPGVVPDMVVLGAAVRCLKSTIIGANALRMAYLGECSHLPAGEIPRIPIVSVDLDKSQETFAKIINAINASPRLQQLLIGKPKPDSLLIRNHSGRAVQIKMAAGSVAGRTLVARWLLGIIFDEAPRMQGKQDGAINLEDALTAIVARMLPGAQISLVGSFWAPKGKVHELVTHRFGRPDSDLVVMVATGPMLRPKLYTPEYCAKIKKADDKAYESDVMSRFADPDEALIPSVDITASTRADQGIGPTHGQTYVAIIDPATRSNAWTLTIIGTRPIGGYELCVAREWIGSRAVPLKGSRVLPEIDEAIRPFGLTEVTTDQAGYDHLTDIAELVNVGFELRLATRDDDIAVKRLPHLFTERLITIPDIRQLRQDLIALRKHPKQGGGSKPILPVTSDGRHCDYGAATLLGMQLLPDAPTAPTPPLDDEEQFCMAQQMKANFGRMNAAAVRLTGAM